MSHPPAPDAAPHPFLSACRGSFTSALRWHQLDALWERLGQAAGAGWYLYAVGQPPPQTPASQDEVLRFIREIDQLLHREHQEDYCGIVYADNLAQPTLVKIYDPHHLGVSCGFSQNPPLPGWIMSQIPPCDLTSPPLPHNRVRWWRRFLTLAT
ncbi:MAG: hypothetical protein WCP34_03740 [Pseudomonadota bacterium]